MLSVDEDARRKFESDWLGGKTHAHSIREYLPGQDAESYLGTLEELVCIDLEFRWKKATSQTRETDRTVTVDEAIVPTRVEDYLREFPELKRDDILKRLIEQEISTRINCGFVVEPSEYRSRFPSVVVDASLFTGEAGTHIERMDSPVAGTVTFPLQFGSYVLTSQLGRGGMGAVYRARQPSAGREVAIKIADVSSLNAMHRHLVAARFETEAHAASSLNHDHIVPIYDVGTIDEQPYYSMRLVEGGDLGEMSKAEPLEPRRAVRYMLGIADGIAAAHARGMLHRDIKPQNILVDAASDRAMLTDFGLARFTLDDSGLTQTGQILGTPSYMAPEQIRDSSAIDARADVYSLGGSLYQLLTGKPPFKAADMHETLRQVLNDEPVAPRRINSGVPIELDTICLKCLEKDPDARYATARELADELQRFLDGLPILAKPAGPIQQLSKWCKRNKKLAAAIGLAIGGTIFGLLAALIGWTTTAQQMRVAESYALAGNSILDNVYTRISEEPVLTNPDAAPIRRFLLQESLKHYRRMIELGKLTVATRAQQAFALTAAGNLMIELGQSSSEAEEYLRAAQEAIAALPQEEQDSALLLRAKSDALNGLATVARKRNDLDRAIEFFRLSQAARRKWTEVAPDSVEAKRKLANALMNEGLVLAAQGDSAGAEARQMDAQKIRRGLLDAGSQDLKLRRDYAQAEFNLAFVELANGRHPDVVPRLHAATRTFQRLVDESPTDAQLWRLLETSRIYEAELRLTIGGPLAADDARKLLEAGLRDLTSLIQLAANQPDSCLPLIELYQQGIEALLRIEQLPQASAGDDSLSALDAWNQLHSLIEGIRQRMESETVELDEPQQLSLLMVRIHALRQQAILLDAAGNHSAALDCVAQALELCQQNRARPLAQERLDSLASELAGLQDYLQSTQ